MSVAVRTDNGVVTRPAAARVVRDYIALTKPRVIVLLEITTLFAMVMAARGWPRTGVVVATLAGGWLAASGANAINMWFDRDIDGAMGRTRGRPIPSGRVAPASALVFGITLGVLAFAVLTVFANVLAAALAIAALLFYVLVYTMWLKRSSTQNIVIGGAAGAIPPLVGWSAVTGGIDLTAVFLFAIIFYWTPPHFWTLALLLRHDYERAEVPMLPVIEGEERTRRQIVLFTVVLVVVTMLPYLARSFGLVYLAGAVVLDGIFLAGAYQVSVRRSPRATRRLFYYSMLYLALLFAVMAIDRVAVAA